MMKTIKHARSRLLLDFEIRGSLTALVMVLFVAAALAIDLIDHYHQ